MDAICYKVIISLLAISPSVRVCVYVVLILLYSHPHPYYFCNHLPEEESGSCFKVKSGMFGQTAKFGQRSCLFHTSIF